MSASGKMVMKAMKNQSYDYIVYSTGTIPNETYYAKNGKTGLVQFTGTFAAVMQSCIDALATGPGGLIDIPAGYYRCFQTITVKQNVKITGHGVGYCNGISTPPVEQNGTCILSSITDGTPVFTLNGGGGSAWMMEITDMCCVGWFPKLTFTQADVDIANNRITKTAHGIPSGSRVRYTTSGVTVGGLTNGSYYFIIAQDADHIQLSLPVDSAFSNRPIDFTSLSGTGTNTLNFFGSGGSGPFIRGPSQPEGGYDQHELFQSKLEITYAGTKGSTRYQYVVTAVDAAGVERRITPNDNGTFDISDIRASATRMGLYFDCGNATLDGTNYNTLTWEAVAGTVNYKIYRTLSKGTPSTQGLIATVASPTVTYSDQGAAGNGVYPPDIVDITQGGTPGTTEYHYRVSATFASAADIPTGWNYDPQDLEIRIGHTAMTTTGPAVLNETNYNILTWPQITGANGYKIYRKSSDGTPSTLGIIYVINDPATTTFNDTGLAVIDSVAGYRLSDFLIFRNLRAFALGSHGIHFPSRIEFSIFDNVSTGNNMGYGLYFENAVNGTNSFYDCVAYGNCRDGRVYANALDSVAPSGLVSAAAYFAGGYSFKVHFSETGGCDFGTYIHTGTYGHYNVGYDENTRLHTLYNGSTSSHICLGETSQPSLIGPSTSFNSMFSGGGAYFNTIGAQAYPVNEMHLTKLYLQSSAMGIYPDHQDNGVMEAISFHKWDTNKTGGAGYVKVFGCGGDNTGLKLEDRLEHHVHVFTDGDATPSVLGADIFTTANTNSTTITNFDNGAVGQVIKIKAEDANTTIQNNTNIRLKGGVNRALTLNETMILVCFSTGWDEAAVGNTTHNHDSSYLGISATAADSTEWNGKAMPADGLGYLQNNGAGVLSWTAASAILDHMPYAYIIYRDGVDAVTDTYYARSGKTGIVDYSGTFAQVVQAANDALYTAASGGTIFIPAGDWFCDHTIYVDFGVHIKGDGGVGQGAQGAGYCTQILAGMRDRSPVFQIRRLTGSAVVGQAFEDFSIVGWAPSYDVSNLDARNIFNAETDIVTWVNHGYVTGDQFYMRYWGGATLQYNGTTGMWGRTFTVKKIDNDHFYLYSSMYTDNDANRIDITTATDTGAVTRFDIDGRWGGGAGSGIATSPAPAYESFPEIMYNKLMIAPQGEHGIVRYGYVVTTNGDGAGGTMGEHRISPNTKPLPCGSARQQAAFLWDLGHANLGAGNGNVLTWEAVSGATYYKVYRVETLGTPNTTGLLKTLTGGELATTYTDTGADMETPSAAPPDTFTIVQNGTPGSSNHTYVVIANFAAGNVPTNWNYNPLCTSIRLSMEAGIVNGAAVIDETNSVTLAWPAVPGVQNYTVVRCLKAGGWDYKTLTTTTNTTYTDTGATGTAVTAYELLDFVLFRNLQVGKVMGHGIHISQRMEKALIDNCTFASCGGYGLYVENNFNGTINTRWTEVAANCNDWNVYAAHGNTQKQSGLINAGAMLCGGYGSLWEFHEVHGADFGIYEHSNNYGALRIIYEEGCSIACAYIGAWNSKLYVGNCGVGVIYGTTVVDAERGCDSSPGTIGNMKAVGTANITTANLTYLNMLSDSVSITRNGSNNNIRFCEKTSGEEWMYVNRVGVNDYDMYIKDGGTWVKVGGGFATTAYVDQEVAKVTLKMTEAPTRVIVTVGTDATALPASPLSGRTALWLHAPSENTADIIMCNSDGNGANLTLEPGDTKYYAFSGVILFYAKVATGTQTLEVEEWK